MTKKKLKALKRAYAECEESDDVFNPTKSDFKYWFDLINRTMFEDSIPYPDRLEIKRMRNLGWAEGDLDTDRTLIKVRDRFVAVSKRSLNASSLQMFVSTVAHEMVHLWQFQTDRTMNHGKAFKEWKTKFKKIGISL